MVDINKMVDAYYPQKFNLNALINLIQEQLSPPSLIKEELKPQTLNWSSIPEIPVSEIGWSQLNTSEEGIEIPSEQRSQLQNFLNNIGGSDLPAKLQSLNEFYEGDEETFAAMVDEDAGATISRVMSYLVFYKTLTTIITNFNASSAGFSFESFLAVLLGGQQVPTGEGTIADLTTADGTPISLKLYSETSVEVGGSYTDLINDLTREDSRGMQYVVVTKSLEGKDLQKKGSLDFYRFNFNLSNVVNILLFSDVAQNARLIELPLEFIGDSTIDYNEGLPAVAAGVSIEELETLFASGVTKMIGDEQKAEMLLQALDWANNEDIFTSVKGKKIPGRSAFVQRAIKNLVVDLAVSEEGEEGIFSLEDVQKIIVGLNTINNQIRTYRSQAGSRRKESLGQLEFASPKASLEFYKTADADALRRALKNSRGYLFKDDFKLNKTNVKQIGTYSESAVPEGQESVYIGTIHVGVANVQDVLSRVTAAINEKVFDIFNNVKVLTTNIQSYFAGGLREDSQADTAIDAAQNIETKTEEIKSEK
tara:strand:+ start:37513 stop:39120 length:1608 start_codon:yes stop_codon:yes gene_type:complete